MISKQSTLIYRVQSRELQESKYSLLNYLEPLGENLPRAFARLLRMKKLRKSDVPLKYVQQKRAAARAPLCTPRSLKFGVKNYIIFLELANF